MSKQTIIRALTETGKCRNTVETQVIKAKIQIVITEVKQTICRKLWNVGRKLRLNTILAGKIVAIKTRRSNKCFPVLFYGLEVCSLRKDQYKSINYVINSTFRKLFNTRSQETVDVRLEMFGCLQAERTIAIRKRKFLNKFSVTHNALCRVFVVIDKTELE